MTTFEQKFQELQKKNNTLQKAYDELKNQTNSTSDTKQNDHSTEFWEDLYVKIRNDPDAVKAMVKNKILSLEHTNKFNDTLLHLSVEYGSYELVQFCINHGADLHVKGDQNRTALDLARFYAYYHIEQLLLFSEMNVNAGNEIKETANIIRKQNGNNMDPLKSELWKTIRSVCKDIVESGSKSDWYWLKTCIIPSTIWLKEIPQKEIDEKKSENETKTKTKGVYLYYLLLELVDDEARMLLKKLESDLQGLADKYPNDWNNLIKFDIPDRYEKVRQDLIPNGIVSRYTYQQLADSSGTTFNSPKFYDYNEYLSQIVLLAQIVDDKFQQSVQDIFNVDKVTNEGKLNFSEYNTFYNEGKQDKDDNVHGDGKIHYMKGPVKLLDRARSKAQNDYCNEDYPASACVIDLNRCSLVFNDISTLLAAVQLFVNKIKYYRSGNIIDIVRDKNGFREYVKQTQYADIKFNVLIKGNHNCIIGEVQFLLRTMKQFKDKAHNLYAIQRQQEAIESSVAKILPLLLDNHKQLFAAACRGNVKSLCKLMVIDNKSVNELVAIDKTNENTILHMICKFDYQKAFSFLQSLLSKEELVKFLFLPNNLNQTPLEYAVRYSCVAVVKQLFDIKEVVVKFEDDQWLFRLFIHLFAANKNSHLIDYILSVLNVSNDKIIDMLRFKYPQPQREWANGAWDYHLYTIITEIVRKNTVVALKKFIQIIGEKTFLNEVFNVDGYNQNALEKGV
eukprot:167625_1